MLCYPDILTNHLGNYYSRQSLENAVKQRWNNPFMYGDLALLLCLLETNEEEIIKLEGSCKYSLITKIDYLKDVLCSEGKALFRDKKIFELGGKGIAWYRDVFGCNTVEDADVGMHENLTEFEIARINKQILHLDSRYVQNIRKKSFDYTLAREVMNFTNTIPEIKFPLPEENFDILTMLTKDEGKIILSPSGGIEQHARQRGFYPILKIPATATMAETEVYSK